MSKRIVIALGGNALGSTLPEQAEAVKITARAIVDLIEDGNQVVIAHGNGPRWALLTTLCPPSSGRILNRAIPPYPYAAP